MQLEQLELTGGGTLTLYLRESVEAMQHFRQRPLVLGVPGGGYNHVSPREGDPVALQFAAAGYHTAVLHYAVGESARDALPMRQLAQAIGLVRQHAEQWNILPDKIALCGFSAGGHLALSGAVLAQYQRSADINLGTGMVVIGLASLIIGETLLGRRSVKKGVIAAILGSIVYRFIYAIVFYTKIVPVECLKLLTAIIVALAIAAPSIQKWATFQKRKMAARNKEGV